MSPTGWSLLAVPRARKTPAGRVGPDTSQQRRETQLEQGMVGVPSCFLLAVTLLFSPPVLVNRANEEEEQIDVLAAN